ncbi:hypothetical protein [Sulfitobacter sabulilitoris]|uniref:Curlin n=1 Tax=Sulfitobacter sabulilitoris TaxID=2562655 RepID=A0A5S3Q5B5_9RHOB|nr:hypothetical protein [Sulfitobacter sabulilitoris]TMM51862.1 hypothetical protein FDT80_14075 [Sulfitobacter sabulilitoris]
MTNHFPKSLQAAKWAMTLAVALASPMALAEPVAPSSAINPANLLSIVDTGTDNLLSILQTPDQGHVATITIAGNRNGGLREAPLSATDWFGPLTPGRIEQSGRAQTVSLAVFGNDNLFAVRQSGSMNIAQGRITGTSNQASVAQAGHGNRAVFSQTGQNNMIVISQSM